MYEYWAYHLRKAHCLYKKSPKLSREGYYICGTCETRNIFKKYKRRILNDNYLLNINTDWCIQHVLFNSHQMCYPTMLLSTEWTRYDVRYGDFKRNERNNNLVGKWNHGLFSPSECYNLLRTRAVPLNRRLCLLKCLYDVALY